MNNEIIMSAHHDLKLTYTEDGVPISNFENAEIYFYLSPENDRSTIVCEKANTTGGGGDSEISWVSDGTDGEFYIHILPIDTSPLATGMYRYEVWMTLSSKEVRLGYGVLQLFDTIKP